MLEIDEDSRLGAEILLNGKRYGAPDVPGDELTAEFYETAVDRLARMGIHRYEISNFARPGFESLHNLKYWRLEPYVGFGADAHSFDGACAAKTSSRQVSMWNGSRAASRPESTPLLQLAKSASSSDCASRTESQPGPKSGSSTKQPIQRFIAEGLLARTARLRLTDRGVLFSNEVFAEFIRHDRPAKRHRYRPRPRCAAPWPRPKSATTFMAKIPRSTGWSSAPRKSLGKEAALFVPTGTMGNTIAVKMHTDHGQEVISDSRAHLLD